MSAFVCSLCVHYPQSRGTLDEALLFSFAYLFVADIIPMADRTYKISYLR